MVEQCTFFVSVELAFWRAIFVTPSIQEKVGQTYCKRTEGKSPHNGEGNCNKDSDALYGSGSDAEVNKGWTMKWYRFGLECN